jgi:hypothetical protein
MFEVVHHAIASGRRNGSWARRGGVANIRSGQHSASARRCCAPCWPWSIRPRGERGRPVPPTCTHIHFATPWCREQAPRRLAACEYSPSLHCAIAPVGSLSSLRCDDGDAVAPAVGAGADRGIERGADADAEAGAGAGAGAGAVRVGVVGAGAGARWAGAAVGVVPTTLTPPCRAHAPRPGWLEEPSEHVTADPVVCDAACTVAFCSALPAVAARFVALASTPP